MNKWLKWSLIVIGSLLIIFLAVFAWYWPSLRILSGTEAISGKTGRIPAPVETALPPLKAGQSDWPSWFGPDGARHALVRGIRTDWTNGLKKLWEVDYLCQGSESASWSAPVILGNRLVVSGRSESDDLVFCLNPANGNLLWVKAYAAQTRSNHGAGPRATPFIDGENIYTFGRNGDLICWRLYDGEKIWHRNVMDEGGEEPTWGHASSPLVLGNMVVVQGGGSCRTIAFDKNNGALIWKSGNGIAGYAPVKAMTLGTETLLLAFHGKGLAALQAADGSELWQIPWETSYDVNATTPLVIDDRVFITSGYKTGSLMLAVQRDHAKVLWRSENHSSVHSDPFYINGFLYGYSGDSFQNKGSFKCLDVRDGREKWSTDEMGWGTCIWVDGYLLTCDIKGNIFLMKPDPEKFILISDFSSALGDIRGPVWTSPVAANGRLYQRFKQKLICYNLTDQPGG